MSKPETAGFNSPFPARVVRRNHCLRPRILRVEQGNTGQLLLAIQPLPRARSYEVRYAPLGTGGPPSTWPTATFTSARKAAPVNSLTPGTMYAFQVRALGRLGYTDWSDSATRMCT
ncbi:MAG TPA: fibronectin type III domain-containing protein [Terriglobia bacterium]|nr:fibronectin type III domain-containing protein [Terriglobia bacterium]